MDNLIQSLAPAFAAGLGIQQLLELLDPITAWLVSSPDKKKIALGLTSLLVGLGLAFGAGLHVLQPLGYTGPAIFDALVTGLIISGGTEGINSIIKILGYTRDQKAADMAQKTATLAEAPAPAQPQSARGVAVPNPRPAV